MAKKTAYIDLNYCVACGACQKVCPKAAIKIWKGIYAIVDFNLCVGCGLCKKTCPAQAITTGEDLR